GVADRATLISPVLSFILKVSPSLTLIYPAAKLNLFTLPELNITSKTVPSPIRTEIPFLLFNSAGPIPLIDPDIIYASTTLGLTPPLPDEGFTDIVPSELTLIPDPIFTPPKVVLVARGS